MKVTFSAVMNHALGLSAKTIKKPRFMKDFNDEKDSLAIIIGDE